MLCYRCNKFGSVVVAAHFLPEEFRDKTVQGEVVVQLRHNACGTTLRESFLEFKLPLEPVHAETCGSDGDYTVHSGVSTFDEFLPPRQKRARHMYGANVTGTVTCNTCSGSAPFSWRGSVQSSKMEEC